MKSLFLFLTVSLVTIATYAQSNPVLEMRVRDLEQKSYRLQQDVFNLSMENRDLNRRVTQLENTLVVPGPLPTGLQACVVHNSSSNQMHLAKASSKLEASAAANKLCTDRETWDNDCKPAVCEPEDGVEHACSVTNSSSNKAYLGKGLSRLEALAAAQSQCTSAETWDNDCAHQKAQCE